MRLVIRRSLADLGGEPCALLIHIAKALLVDHWRHQEVARLYQEALAGQPEAYAPSAEAQATIREALLGQAQALNFLAGQDYRRRRFGPAESRFLQALALTERAVGPESPRLLPLLDILTLLYRSQQRENQAVLYEERATRLRAVHGG